MNLCLLFLTSLGFLSLLRHLIIPLLTYLFFFLSTKRPPTATTDLRARYGPWALVTGPTDGIGLAFAVELAQQGMNLVLVGRNSGKLKTASGRILAEVGNDVEIRTLVVDFATTEDVGKVVRDGVRGLEMGVLVNNVGITYPAARYFHEVEEKVWMEIVRVNMEGTTAVTRAVVGGMIERRKGAVVNVGSGAASVMPSHPLFTIYAASKAYVDQLSRSLHVEYKQMGIDVQCQVPLYVATEMTRKVAMIKKPSLFIPSPEAYAAAAVRRIGHGEARCTPYWAHSLQWYLASLVPEFLLDSWRLSIGTRRRELDIVTKRLDMIN